MCVFTKVARDKGHNGNSEGVPETLRSLSSRGVRRNCRVPDCQKRVKISQVTKHLVLWQLIFYRKRKIWMLTILRYRPQNLKWGNSKDQIVSKYLKSITVQFPVFTDVQEHTASGKVKFSKLASDHKWLVIRGEWRDERGQKTALWTCLRPGFSRSPVTFYYTKKHTALIMSLEDLAHKYKTHGERLGGRGAQPPFHNELFTSESTTPSQPRSIWVLKRTS